MSDVIELARDDDLVRALLAPLERVRPVTLPRAPRRTRPLRRPLLIAVAIGAAMLLVGGLALAGAFGPLHNATLKPNAPTLPLPNSSTLACQLIGQPAEKAAALLTQDGYQIEWRFQHWGGQSVSPGNSTTPGAVSGGYTSAPESVPADSVIWDITPDERAPNKLFVFVQAPNDPNAPTITPPTCTSR